jgi:C-terminal processing protease CtpA/Prc
MFVSKRKVVTAAVLALGILTAAGGGALRATAAPPTKPTVAAPPDAQAGEKAGPKEAEGNGYIGIQIKADPDNGGVSVEGVVEDGPAAKGGLKAGDVIVQIGDVKLKDKELPEVVGLVRDSKPGDTITLKVKRDGKDKTIKVKVGKRPE